VREVAPDAPLPTPVPGSIRTPAAVGGPGGGRRYEVVVTARALVRDVALLVDKVHPEASVDDQLVTLLPGESVTFTVSVPEPLGRTGESALTARRVLRTANQLVAGPSTPGADR